MIKSFGDIETSLSNFINPDIFIFNFVESGQKVFTTIMVKQKSLTSFVVEFLKSYSSNWRDNQSNYKSKSIWLVNTA